MHANYDMHGESCVETSGNQLKTQLQRIPCWLSCPTHLNGVGGDVAPQEEGASDDSQEQGLQQVEPAKDRWTRPGI